MARESSKTVDIGTLTLRQLVEFIKTRLPVDAPSEVTPVVRDTATDRPIGPTDVRSIMKNAIREKYGKAHKFKVRESKKETDITREDLVFDKP